MLPPERRVHRSAEFSQIVRRGVRAGRPLLAVHLLLPVAQDPVSERPSAAGLVVGKAVGCAVIRHRTSRRLRHLLLAPLDDLPPGTRLVVRAQGGAGAASTAALRLDLEAALAAALTKAARALRQQPAPTSAVPKPTAEPAGGATARGGNRKVGRP